MPLFSLPAIVGIFTRQLERCLIGLGAGVTEEDPVGEGSIDKHFGQTRDRLIGVAVAWYARTCRPGRSGLAPDADGHAPQRVHGDAAGKIDILFGPADPTAVDPAPRTGINAAGA